ncbi:MAG: hypothetical protein ACERKZ_21985 [Lachnotalea sp.]
MNDKVALSKWCNKTVTEKIFYALQILVTIFIIFVGSLQIFDVWDKAINVLELLLGVEMILMFLQYRKYSKVTAYTFLGVAILIFCSGLVILISQVL